MIMMRVNNILILDDSRMILEISKNIIEKNMEFTKVQTVLDPDEGMKILLEQKFEVIILDIVMPKVTGIEVLKWIKEQPELEHLKVIMFTSLNDSEALSECFNLGAYDFITKPLEENEFIARLNHGINEYIQEETIRDNFHKLEHMNDQLLDLNTSLKETQLELVQKDRLASVGHLAAGMAHEVNNPLGFLKSNIVTMGDNTNSLINLYNAVTAKVSECDSVEELSAFIKESESKYDYEFIVEDGSELLDDIKHGLNRIHAIVEALRKFSQDDAGSGIEPISLTETVDNILIMLQSKIDNQLDVEVTAKTNVVVNAKKADFNMAIMSIIDNAIDAIEAQENLEKGKLKIIIEELPSTVFIVIDDNGIGMSDEVLKHSVDPFYTTKDVGSGVGLGLSTAHNCFVKDMKGTMNISSEVGSGTQVRIMLPKEENENG